MSMGFTKKTGHGAWLTVHGKKNIHPMRADEGIERYRREGDP
jgi:hypothetical protein